MRPRKPATKKRPRSVSGRKSRPASRRVTDSNKARIAAAVVKAFKLTELFGEARALFPDAFVAEGDSPELDTGFGEDFEADLRRAESMPVEAWASVIVGFGGDVVATRRRREEKPQPAPPKQASVLDLSRFVGDRRPGAEFAMRDRMMSPRPRIARHHVDDLSLRGYGVGAYADVLAAAVQPADLRRVDLADNRMSAEESARIVRALPPEVTRLDVSGNRGATLMGCKARLERLTAANVGLTPTRCYQAIESALRLPMVHTLQSLNLSNNQIGEFGCVSLAFLLRADVAPRLGHLFLASNAITGSAAAHILRPLIRENTRLVTLDLSFNSIFRGPEGTTLLGKVFRSNTSLRHLALTSNNATHDTVDTLGPALAQNKTIVGLHADDAFLTVDARGFLQRRPPCREAPFAPAGMLLGETRTCWLCDNFQVVPVRVIVPDFVDAVQVHFDLDGWAPTKLERGPKLQPPFQAWQTKRALPPKSCFAYYFSIRLPVDPSDEKDDEVTPFKDAPQSVSCGNHVYLRLPECSEFSRSANPVLSDYIGRANSALDSLVAYHNACETTERRYLETPGHVIARRQRSSDDVPVITEDLASETTRIFFDCVVPRCDASHKQPAARASCFGDRQRDEGSLSDTDERLRKCFLGDWTRIDKRIKPLVRRRTDQAKSALWSVYRPLRAAYRFYAEPTVFKVTETGFVRFCEDARVLVDDYGAIFRATGASSHLERHQFVEAALRLAIAAYYDTQLAHTVASSMRWLKDALDQVYPSLFPEPDSFRADALYIPPTEKFLAKAVPELRAIFHSLVTHGGLINYETWCSIAPDEAHLFSLSQLTRAIGTRPPGLTFVDFVEALWRLASRNHQQQPPTECFEEILARVRDASPVVTSVTGEGRDARIGSENAAQRPPSGSREAHESSRKDDNCARDGPRSSSHSETPSGPHMPTTVRLLAKPALPLIPASALRRLGTAAAAARQSSLA